MLIFAILDLSGFFWPLWFFAAFIKYCIISWFPSSTDSTLEQFRPTKEIKYLLKCFSLSVYLKKIGMGSHDKWQCSAITFSINVLLHCLKYHNVAGCCLPLVLNDDGSDEDVVICKLLIRLSIKIWNVYDNFGEKKQRKRHTRSICRSLWQHGKLKILLFRLFPGLFKIIVPQRENKIGYCC